MSLSASVRPMYLLYINDFLFLLLKWVNKVPTLHRIFNASRGSSVLDKMRGALGYGHIIDPSNSIETT